MKSSAFAVALFSLAVVLGCSGNGTNPLQPTSPPPVQTQSTPQPSSHFLMGYWLIRADPDTNQLDAMPVRDITTHMNVLNYLEKSPCTDCLKFAWGGYTPPGRIWNIDVSLRHPLHSLNMTIFDVRGITIFNGSFQFPELGLTTSDRNSGDCELVNADGYTSLYNPSTAGHGTGGYLDGKLATDTVPNAALNGYKRFISDKPGNTRNAFWPQDIVAATFQLRMESPVVFGYAIDANWEPPIEKPVDDPMTDFSLSANCPEAWQISVSEEPLGEGLTDNGGSTKLTINVYDWQGKDDAHPVIIECPGLFDGEINPTWVQDSDGFTTYEAIVENSLVASEGQYRCLISKEAAENDSSDPWLDLTAYQIHELGVTGKNYWARTWGGVDNDQGASVAVDASGSTYVTGAFRGTVDFDPGDGVEEHTAIGYSDIFLSKFDLSGVWQWTFIWGSASGEAANDLTLSESGDLFLSGSFSGTMDFDPGPGVEDHTSNGGSDCYLLKLTSSGDLMWVRTWGGTSSSASSNAAIIDGSGNAHVTGSFTGTVDFDPGSGTDNHTSVGSNDVFLTTLDSDGNFLWAQTWGGTTWEYGRGVAVDPSGNSYVAGDYYDIVDFDPGPGEDIHAAILTDLFLSKFSASGEYQWVRTWGGFHYDHGSGVVTDTSGNAYVAGTFVDWVDFDPGPGEDKQGFLGGGVFLSKFDPSGNHDWARIWAAEEGNGLAIDGSDNIYVAGYYWFSCDFDPGSGVDEHSAIYLDDIFVSKIDSSGNYQWATTWGGSRDDQAIAVATDSSGNSYVTGWFEGNADFNPGPASDEHISVEDFDVFISKLNPDGSW